MALPLSVVASGAITANGQTVAMTAALLATGTVQVSGTWTGTLTFEATVDGTTWGTLAMTPLAGGASVTTATADGTWKADIEALVAIRVRATAAITGSATVALAGSSQLYTALVAPGGLSAGSIPYTNASGALAGDASVLNVKGFGATGNGTTDDTTAIQAAIAALPANGGTVYFPQGVYKVTSTLAVGTSVSFVGGGSYNVNPGNGSTTTAALSLILWAGASGGTVVAINGPVWALHMEHIAVDGGGTASIGVKAERSRNAHFDNMRIANCAMNCLWLGTTSAVANDNAMFNLFSNVALELAPVPLYIAGMATANTCHNTFINTYIDHQANPGIFLGSSDNNTFIGTDLFQRNGTTGTVIYTQLTAGGTGYPDSGTLAFTGGGGANATATYAASGGVIQSISMTAYGTGYTSAPTVAFSGGGTGATATAFICQEAVYLGGSEQPAASGNNIFFHLQANGLRVKAGATAAVYHYDQLNNQPSPVVETGGTLMLTGVGLHAVQNIIPLKTRFDGQVVQANNTYFGGLKSDGTTLWNLLAVGGDNHVYMGGVNAVAAALTKVYAGGTQALTLTNGGHVLLTGAGTTSAAAGANAGSTPPSPLLTLCTDAKGDITFGTGTTPAAGAQVVVTFGAAYGAAPSVVVAAKNTATQALGLYVSSVGTGGFTLSTTTAPAASQANTIYSFTYHVLGST